MDTEDRRYFKQQEITLWRKGDKQRKQNLQSPMMSGTQNFNSEQQRQVESESESIHSDTSDHKKEGQIQSMTREVEENQQQNSSEQQNNCSE